MNWEHLRAFLWLHSRIRANKSKRTKPLSKALHAILSVLSVIFGIFVFAGTLIIAVALSRKSPSVSPSAIMFGWDGLVAAFIFFWLVMLSVELQRSELLPLEKFLHYPVSVSGLFLINYVASILNEHATMYFFGPAMLGLATGMVIGRGAGMLWLFPLIVAFFLMVTALTYQFRGWLAVLMLNKRHRRTVVTVVTVTTMLIAQLPYLSSRVFGTRHHPVVATSREQVGQIVTVANKVLPIGWLPYGVRASWEGKPLPVLLVLAGMTLIGAVSLRRSYATTMRLYTGNYGSGRTRPVPVAAAPSAIVTERPATKPSAPIRSVRGSLLEMKLPWFSEPASAVALATFRSLLRAPEAKMVLVSPVIMLVFFGGAVLKGASSSSQFTRPLMASGILTMVLFSMSQLVANQFAFDRAGFRNYVLSFAPRRDILLGKNLALAPVALGVTGVALIVLQVFQPMRIDHFIGMLFQMTTMYLLDCLFANFLSIVNPTAVKAGSMRPAVRPSGKTILFSLLTFFLFPLILAPSMIPLGLEYGLHWMGGYTAVPVFLLLSIIEAAGMVGLYLWALDREGEFLQSRELKILDIVTARVGDD